MWPFNRNQEKTNLKDKVSPTAVKEYYQAVGKQQTWLTWVLSILAFIVTLLLVLGLFWGGRWVWNKVTDSTQDKPNTTQEQSASDQQQEAQRQGNNSEGTNNSNGGSANPQNNPGTPAPPSQTQPTPNSAPTTTPQTGDSLPATGPSSDE